MIHHALVVAQIGIGMERHQSEKDHERFAQSIGGLNGHVEGEIVEGPLRSLHPVDDTLPLRVRRASRRTVTRASRDSSSKALRRASRYYRRSVVSAAE